MGKIISMSFIYFLLFLLFLSLFSLFLFYTFLLIGYLITKVPFVSLSKKDIHKILKMMNLKEGEVLVDLGCGDSQFLIEAEKKYKVKTIGYELSLTAFILSKINILLKKAKTKIYLKDFFKINLSYSDVIFCYLFPNVMARLSEKLKKEVKTGTKIFSLAFPLPDWPNEKILYLDEKNKKGKIFIYQK